MLDGSVTIAFIESPIQIMVVLLIALIVFGPKRLPELGKQLGNGLRELNKAKNDLMRSINLDHEPEPEPYNYSYPSNDTSYANAYTPPPDLTDYTIAGQPLHESHPMHDAGIDGMVARSSGTEYNNDYADYSVAPAHEANSHDANGHETAPGASHDTQPDSHPAVSRDPILTRIEANPEGDHRV